MLRSGNDCAETLAHYVSGSNEKFALLMNETAKRIGAKNSNFVNPHGLHNDNHYTTAYDLALISAYAIKNTIFKEIVSTKKIVIPSNIKEYDRVMLNKNKMLKEYDGATGIKTGFTKKAGRCLVSSAYRNGLELICVVLNCPQMFERSKTLLNFGYDNFKAYKLVESDNIIDFVKSSRGEIPICIKKDIVLPLTNAEYENIRIEYNYPSEITDFSIDEIGNIKIYSENNLIFTEKIYSIL
jgi:D-alanyl-D-alanine carboxypeptidase (penicillin-binding protein 5/6)